MISKKITDSKTNKNLEEIDITYYNQSKIWNQKGTRVKTNLGSGKESNSINWGEPIFVNAFDLSFDEKILVLINKGEFKDDLDFNIKKGPLKIIPEVVEKVRDAKTDMSLFNINIDSAYSKIQILKNHYLQYNSILEKIDKEIEELKLHMKKNNKKQEILLLQKQGEYSAVLEEQLKKEKEYKIQDALVYQLGEIGSMVNNYENEIEKYKILYYEKKMKNNI